MGLYRVWRIGTAKAASGRNAGVWQKLSEITVAGTEGVNGGGSSLQKTQNLDTERCP
jgi:hypothetical protein